MIRALSSRPSCASMSCATAASGSRRWSPIARSDGSMPSAGSVVTSVSADRWHAVLIAGDDNIPAFDNGVVSLRDKLAGLGVKNIRVLAADPGRPAGEVRASSSNVRGALRGLGGGDACMAFVTSHGNETGFFLRADGGFIQPPQL